MPQPKKNCRVSIIIPARNEAHDIAPCLDSIFALDYPPEQYQVIVMDNGSTDNTAEIARQKGAEVLVSPVGTIASLRNQGVEASHGSIVAFLDADCTVPPDWLGKAEKYFSASDVACFGSPPVIPTPATWVQKTWFLVRKKNAKTLEVNWLESMNMFVHRHIFLQAGGFNEALVTCEDVDLSYRLSKFGKIIGDQEIVATHHGEAKTLKEFFIKERWRGKSNYRGLKEHPLRIDELPSLTLPIYYCVLFFVLIPCLALTEQWKYFFATILLWQIPIFILTLMKISKAGASPSFFFRLVLLYNVYFLARGVAIL